MSVFLPILETPKLLLYFTTNTVSITPTIGPAELLVNNTFTAWTADNPDGWSVIGEFAPDPEVTERDPGQGHADVKTVGGAANFFGTAALSLNARQSIATINSWYRIDTTLSNIVAGGVRLSNAGTILKIITTTGSVPITHRATAVDYRWNARSAANDATLNTASVKELTNFHQLFTHARSFGDFSVALTIPDTSYQGGVVFNLSDSNNFMRLWYDRLDGRIYLVQKVAGVFTTLGSWLTGYVAGAVLTGRRHKNGTIDILYGGAPVISGIASTGLTGLQAGPFLTDSSGVTISNYTWDARSTT